MNLRLCSECCSVIRRRGVCPNCGTIEEGRVLSRRFPPNEDAIERVRSIGPVWGGADPVEAGYTQVGPPTIEPRHRERRAA